MELRRDFHFLKVEKKGFVDSSSIIAIRDSKGLTCLEIGGGGDQNIKQTVALFEEEGLNISDIHTVIISHTHADHMGAIAHFQGLVPGITVVDHEVDAPFLQDNTLLNRIFDTYLVPKYFPGKAFDILEFYAAFCPISETNPDQTVVEGDTLGCGEYSFEVIHTPGHHPGHISLYEGDQGVLFVGDMLGMEVPFYTPSSGGVEGYLRSMQKYQALEVNVIIPSHGDLIENPQEVIEDAVRKVKHREERLLDALKGTQKTFNKILPELFRNTTLHMFPGAAVLASHLEKLEKEGLVQEEGNKYWHKGS
jgi:glyoxylase-like metal-dependent hydrolase (beta-lactamase superfamily II)